MENNFNNKVQAVLDEIQAMLHAKNLSYGNSALDPVRIFSKGKASEGIRIRIDDKLNRMFRGNMQIENEKDTILDLMGYLVLLLISEELV